jgi:hypothetical protein
VAELSTQDREATEPLASPVVEPVTVEPAKEPAAPAKKKAAKKRDVDTRDKAADEKPADSGSGVGYVPQLDTPSAGDDVRSAAVARLKSFKPDIASCLEGQSGTVKLKVKILVDLVSSAKVIGGPFKGTDEAKCIDSALTTEGGFPKSRDVMYEVTHTFVFK